MPRCHSFDVVVERPRGASVVLGVHDRMGGDELYSLVAERLYGSPVSACWLSLRHARRELPRSGLSPVGLFDGMVLHAARRDLLAP